MNPLRLGTFLIIALAPLAWGCAQNTSPPRPDKEAQIQAALDKLDPDDRKLAQEQIYCAVRTKNRLGSMGAPIKVMVKDRPVFLCCKSCVKTAEKDPDQTLATVEKLKNHRESNE